MAAQQHPGWRPDRLRQLRQAHGLSLEALGDRLRATARQAGLSVPAANYQTLWQHEHGQVYPSRHYRRAYCLLYQATEPTLGFRPPLPGETVTAPPSPGSGDDDDVRRRQFLRDALLGGMAAASGIASAPVADLIRVALSPTQPAHPGDGDLTRFHDALTRLYELDDHYGGGGVYTLAVQAVHRIRHLVNRTILRSDTERALLTLAGHAAEHAGWLAYDAGLPGQARYWWSEALHTARHLDSDTLTTSVMTSMSLQAADTGQPSDALDLAHCAAQAARTRTTPRLASLLSARLAVGHAKTGDRRAAQRALSHAHDCVDQPWHDDDPPWLDFWGRADLAWHETIIAVALHDLPAAETAARTALDTVDVAAYPRNHAIYLTGLAETLVARQALDEAIPVTARAVTHTVGLDSHRLTSGLQTVLTTLRRDHNGTAVRRLCDWASTMLPEPVPAWT